MTDAHGDERTRLQRFWLSKSTLVLTRRGAIIDGFFAAVFWFHWDRPLAAVVLFTISLASAGMSVHSWRTRREARQENRLLDRLG